MSASPPPPAPLARAESSSSLSSNASLSAGNTPTVGKLPSPQKVLYPRLVLPFLHPSLSHVSISAPHYTSPCFLHSSPYRIWAQLFCPRLLRTRAALFLFFLSTKPKWVSLSSLFSSTLLFPHLQSSCLLYTHLTDVIIVIIMAC